MPSILDALIPRPEVLAGGLAVAVALDLAYPRHSGILLKVHPVRTSYLMALRLARPYGGRAYGVALWFSVVALHMAVGAAILVAFHTIHPLLHTLAVAAILKMSISLRLLLDTCIEAGHLLKQGDIAKARAAVQGIVRRDTSTLPSHLTASACIESMAESLVDGYTSPLTLYPVLGPLWPLLQRLANTLDGAVGFKTPEVARLGWFSARVDTLLNLVPARLTALAIAVAAPLAGGSLLGGLRSWIRNHGSTESLNAGHPMSALAGALGVVLEKRGSYVIHGGGRLPGWLDVFRAVRIVSAAAALYTLATVAALLLLAWVGV